LPSGQRAASEFRRAHRQRLEQLLDVLGTRDTDQLLRIFERAATRLSSPSNYAAHTDVAPGATR
ncbi:MAG: hypothetical protein VCC04_02060, partial [Myxococcota bacterium]